MHLKLCWFDRCLIVSLSLASLSLSLFPTLLLSKANDHGLKSVLFRIKILFLFRM